MTYDSTQHAANAVLRRAFEEVAIDTAELADRLRKTVGLLNVEKLGSAGLRVVDAIQYDSDMRELRTLREAHRAHEQRREP